jgi:hypothetical protein
VGLLVPAVLVRAAAAAAAGGIPNDDNTEGGHGELAASGLEQAEDV